MKLKYTLLALAAMTALGSAATISVNFTGSGAANQQLETTTSAGLTGYVAQNWNNASTNSGTLDSLNQDNAGSASVSTASVTWNGGGVWRDDNADTDATAGVGNAVLARGYLDDRNAGVTFSVSGIPFAAYSLVLYYSGDQDGGKFLDATANGNTQSTTGDKHRYQTPTWDATNTIVFNSLSGDLTVSIPATTGAGGDGSNRGSIAGFQIVQVPELSSTALLGLGGLALILRRRK